MLNMNNGRSAVHIAQAPYKEVSPPPNNGGQVRI
jgi:hypothetical protein